MTATPNPATEPAHRVPLAETGWSVWREVAIRSAGFPADMVRAVCDDELANRADTSNIDHNGVMLNGDDTAYAEATARLSRAIAATHADPAFQEAVTWQNPVLAQFLHDHDAGPDAPRRSKQRQRELVIANYLQRYCLKNDTIGFFGPVGWAFADPGAVGLAVTPGDELIAGRTTHFEVWAINKVAAAIAAQGRQLGWLRPRRVRAAFVAGSTLHRPNRQPVTLTDAELRVYRACDGSRTLAEALAVAGGPDARPLLARLAELGALRMDLDGPVDAWPERLLLDHLDLIPDVAQRKAARTPVERMIDARDEVAASAGDAAKLRRALADLATTFEEVSGSSATRRAGELYAGRTLVYQDALRDVRVDLGAPVLAALAAPLGLVLDSARWLVNDIAARYRVLFTELIDRESARSGGAPVPLPRLLTLASPDLVMRGDRVLGEIAAASVADFQRRWRDVLGPADGRRHQVRAEAIAARAAECFPGQPVPWSGARQHSPDIMIAAASPADVERGDFLLVLGELHLAGNTLDSRFFSQQHPDPARLRAADQADHGSRRIVAIPAKDLPYVTSRTSPPSALLGPDQLCWTVAATDSLDPANPATVLPGAAMSVSRRGDDILVHVASSGAELDFFEVIGDILSGIATNAFRPLARAEHQPRVMIDRFVLSREEWIFQVAGSGWAFVTDERERFDQARRWRREHGLPEQVFFRVPVEHKPMAADFRSLILVNLLAKHIRATRAAGLAEFSVSEMLPDLDQLWLTDHAGRRYSSELRMVAYDGLGGR